MDACVWAASGFANARGLGDIFSAVERWDSMIEWRARSGG